MIEKIEVYTDGRWIVVDDLSCVLVGSIFRFVSDQFIGASLIAFDNPGLVRLDDGRVGRKISGKVLNMDNTVVCADCTGLFNLKENCLECPVCGGDLEKGDVGKEIYKEITSSESSLVGRILH